MEQKHSDQMFKYFSANSTRKYIDVLDALVDQYNNNETKVWRNLYPEGDTEVIVPKFSIGDKIRITKKKGTFEKAYTPRWSEEVFTVSRVQHTDPSTYKITDYNDEEIQGTFYEQ